jgi:lipopolysaccharide/colanic/teichoic acid biosynthesis glycosyltransferase
MVEQRGGLAGMARGDLTDGVETPPVPPLPRHRGLWLKHALDRVAAAFGLLVTAPVILGVALALRLAGPGPVLVRRERIGEGGRPVLVRSFAITDDLSRSRGWRLVTSTGATALPQLWSVLRGEMSIVGPRPREVGFEPPPARPGLTGLAQLELLDRWLPVAEQLDLDEAYARTWSLALDARIVARTMWRTLSSGGGQAPRRP